MGGSSIYKGLSIILFECLENFQEGELALSLSQIGGLKDRGTSYCMLQKICELLNQP